MQLRAALIWLVLIKSDGKKEAPARVRAPAARTAFTPTPEQWAAFTVEPVRERLFRPGTHRGQDRGRRGSFDADLFALCRPRHQACCEAGRHVERGQTLFSVEATDMVQAQNDFITASTA